MKGFILFARQYFWLTFAIPFAVEAQDNNPYPNYVVIGAFAKHKNAINFTSEAKRNNFPARFEMNPNRNLFYVYVLTTSDHEVAVEQALKLRAETKYFDTWVYAGALGKLQPGSVAQSQDYNPATGKKMELVRSEQRHGLSEKSDDQPSDPVVSREWTAITEKPLSVKEAQEQRTATEPGDPQLVARIPSNETDRATDTKENITAGEQPTENKTVTVETPEEKADIHDLLPKRTTDAPLTSEEVVGKDFYFSLFRADNHNVIEGEVDAIDFERSRKMATYAANTPVKVMMPGGKSKQVSFVCQVFGYRKLQKEFDPANPSGELYLDDKGNLVVPFELVRLQKGDIAIMYNVFFFKDAAVMRPESRYEVNNLLELLVENPGYKIRIHGHTNGNATGKIIRMDKPDNFYSLTGTKEGFGSAKKLSEERALVIREYLISSGINPDRMEIKAWGGKKPLFDKNSARAVENVRVEIEILSE